MNDYGKIEIKDNGSIIVTGDILNKLMEHARKGGSVAIGDGALAKPGCISIGTDAESGIDDGKPNITFSS